MGLAAVRVLLDAAQNGNEEDGENQVQPAGAQAGNNGGTQAAQI